MLHVFSNQYCCLNGGWSQGCVAADAYRYISHYFRKCGGFVGIVGKSRWPATDLLYPCMIIVKIMQGELSFWRLSDNKVV